MGANTRQALRGEPQGRTSRKRSIPTRVRRWIERYGLWAVFALSAIHNPFVDIVGIAAGALRRRMWRFLLSCWLGKTVKTLVVAWMGAGVLSVVARLLLR